MFAAPPVFPTEVFATLPDTFRKPQKKPACFLEGPAFDRAGNLYVVNIPAGQILKVDAAGKFSLVAEYDGEPNGLAIHKDGTFYIADHRRGLLTLDPATGTVKTLIDRPRREGFKGLNDLTFSSSGELYFTDQGQSGLHDPTGRLWRWTEKDGLDLLLDNIPSPNGLVVSLDERLLYLAVTRANAVWRVPLRARGGVGRVGVYLNLSGGAGPDGMALDENGGLMVAHIGMGSVWHFNEAGRPVGELPSCMGNMPTNMAFGGADGKTVYITESHTGTVLRAQVGVAGKKLYSHA